jgi:hypothetical protein
MPKLERTPLDKVVGLWTTSDEAFKLSDVRIIWPELADALDALVTMKSRVITEPSAVRVPPIAPTSPGAAPRTASAPRTGPDTPDVPRTDRDGHTWTTPSIFEGKSDGE